MPWLTYLGFSPVIYIILKANQSFYLQCSRMSYHITPLKKEIVVFHFT